MRSRAEAARLALEWLLRAAAVVVLVLALGRAMRPDGGTQRTRVASENIRGTLAAWSRDPQATEVHVTFGAMPSDTLRDWLVALGSAGASVSYDSPDLQPLAIAAEPVADPAGGVRISVATREPTSVRDAAGALDSVRPLGAGAIIDVGGVTGSATAAVSSLEARAPRSDSLLLRRLLVLGSAGWESKFAIAALEERGWNVVARLLVAPGVVVEQQAVGAVDTSRYSAVIALDSAAAPYAGRIAAYVRSGGGLVLAPGAMSIAALAALAPAAAGNTIAGVRGALVSADPRRGLPLVPLVRLREGAVSLEMRGNSVAAAARRVGAGRVLLHGYPESWRWRMLGTDAAPADHRAWWAGVVAAVAYAPSAQPDVITSELASDAAHDAPLARLTQALGAPSPPPSSQAPAIAGETLPWWLFAIATLALLAEWLSRRTRGVR